MLPILRSTVYQSLRHLGIQASNNYYVVFWSLALIAVFVNAQRANFGPKPVICTYQSNTHFKNP